MDEKSLVSCIDHIFSSIKLIDVSSVVSSLLIDDAVPPEGESYMFVNEWSSLFD